jgi:hypothetical protein
VGGGIPEAVRWERLRAKVAKAMRLTDGAYDVDDLVNAVNEGRMQAWWVGESVVVTEILVYPKFKVLNVFTAAGRMEDMPAIEAVCVEVAKLYGCKTLMMSGRTGWTRSFLTDKGWTVSPLVTLTKEVPNE